MTCSLLFWLNCSGGQWKDWTFQRGLSPFHLEINRPNKLPVPSKCPLENPLKSTVSRKTTVRKKCGGKDVCQWGRVVAESCVLSLGSCPLGGAEAEGCCDRDLTRSWTAEEGVGRRGWGSGGGTVLSALVMESQGKCSLTGLQKLFYPCPPTCTACLLHLPPTAPLLRSGGFALILWWLLTPRALFFSWFGVTFLAQ